MLRFGGRDNQGRRLIGMILSRQNVERLKDGCPVFFEGSSVGVDDVVVLIHVTDRPEADLLEVMAETAAAGGEVRTIEEVLDERAAVRAAGGDPDEPFRH